MSSEPYTPFRVDKGSYRASRQEESEPTCTKIYYASRTHSQLSQIFPELSKLKSQPRVAAIVSASHELDAGRTHRKRPNDEDSASFDHFRWRTVSLGSRRQLCINEDLRAKGGDLDEKCRELLSGTGRNSKSLDIDR